MCFKELTNKLKKKMQWYDFSLIKLSTFFFTLALVSGWSWFRDFTLSIDWYWYAVVAIIFSVPILKKMFSK